MQSKKWEFIARPSKDGHRFFKSKADGRVAIADNSGIDPDNTDDGALYIDNSRMADISLLNGYASVAIPVCDDRHREGGCVCKCFVGVTVKDAIYLANSDIWKNGFSLSPMIAELNELLLKLNTSGDVEQ